jgi:hypothetical protein
MGGERQGRNLLKPSPWVWRRSWTRAPCPGPGSVPRRRCCEWVRHVAGRLTGWRKPTRQLARGCGGWSALTWGFTRPSYMIRASLFSMNDRRQRRQCVAT